MLDLIPTPPTTRRRALMVAIEGCDGTGKTTLAASLKAALADTHPVLPIKRPIPGSLAAAILRDALSSPDRAHALKDGRLAAAMNEDAHLATAAARALSPGCVAILDRHWLSAVVEQGADAKAQRNLHGEPDLWVICTADWRTVAERLASRGDQDARMGVGGIGARLALYECAADHLHSPVVWVHPDRVVLASGGSVHATTPTAKAAWIAYEIVRMMEMP